MSPGVVISAGCSGDIERVPLMARRNRLSIDYDSMVVPGLLGGSKESTFVGAELEYDLEVLKSSWEKHCWDEDQPDCSGVWDFGIKSRVLGCKGYSERYHFLLPWIEMKKRGIPKFLRTHPTVVLPLCNNCYLLYDSKHRRLKTAWVKEAGLQVHKSPSYMRKNYDQSYKSLLKSNNIVLVAATKFLNKQFKSNAIVQEFTINTKDGGGNTTTNIDTSELRTLGKIVITAWMHPKHPDYETPM